MSESIGAIMRTEERQVACACGATGTCTVIVAPNGKTLGGAIYVCPGCAAAQEAARAQVEREEREAQMVRQCLRETLALDIPPLFAKCMLADLRPFGSAENQAKFGRAVQICRRIIGELAGGFTPPPFVAFLGAPGSGKTQLAWCTARELTSVHGKTARVIRLSALIRELRSSWGKDDGASEDECIRLYAALDFLVIDEVSRHAFYGKQIHQHLYDVINARLEAERPTLLTSNETDAGLAEILGPALMDRLETGGVVEFGSESHRRLPRAAA